MLRVKPVHSYTASARRKLRMATHYLKSTYGAYENRDLFSKIEKYCMFIGYPRSGHSLVGSLLDAHENLVISHELDALKYLKWGFTKNQFFHLILENSKNFSIKGREWTGYSYFVPNQWHNRFTNLKVIGDKKGGGSTILLKNNPNLLEKLLNTIIIPVKFIHVTRNPFDNISRMLLRNQIQYDNNVNKAADDYFSFCETILSLKNQIHKSDIFDFKIESLIDNPKTVLRNLLSFLDIKTSDDYLRDCSSIIFKNPKKSRADLKWTQESKLNVTKLIEAYEFLDGYYFDSQTGCSSALEFVDIKTSE